MLFNVLSNRLLTAKLVLAILYSWKKKPTLTFVATAAAVAATVVAPVNKRLVFVL